MGYPTNEDARFLRDFDAAIERHKEKESESLRTENERLKEAMKDKDVTIARLRDALEYKVKWVVEMRDGKPYVPAREILDATPKANRRAIEAEGMRMAADKICKLGLCKWDIAHKPCNGYPCADVAELHEAADRHERGEKE